MDFQQTSHSNTDPASLTTESENALSLSSACGQVEDNLRQYEETITRILVEGIFRAGAILRKIRNEKLYQPDHRTFEDYLLNRWGWSYSHVHRIVDASVVTNNLLTSPIGEFVHPTAESQVRPLVRLKDPEKQRTVWNRAVQIAEGRVPTAKQVKTAVLEIGPPPSPKDRRAKSTIVTPVLDQTAPDEAVGDYDNLPSASEAEEARGRAESENQDAVELAAAPTHTISHNEDGCPESCEVLLSTEPAVGSDCEPVASARAGDGGSSDEDNRLANLDSTSSGTTPQQGTLGDDDGMKQSVQTGELNSLSVAAEVSSTGKVVVESVEPLCGSQPSAEMPVLFENVEKERDSTMQVAFSCPSTGEDPKGFLHSVQPVARFTFADNTEVTSTICRRPEKLPHDSCRQCLA